MNIDYPKALEAVKAFVAMRVGVPIQELSEDTRIEEDIAIAGLDTLTLYEEFFDEFRIVNPEAFNLEAYMTPEVLRLKRLVKAVLFDSEREKLQIKTTTIRHLTRVAMQRKWFEQE